DHVVRLGGAAAEQRTAARDRHGRIPASENPAVAEHTERALPLQQAAETLVSAVRRAAGGGPVFRAKPWPSGHRWAAAITHDLDIVSGWPLFASLRWAELVRKGEFARSARAVAAATAGLTGSPVRQSLARILEIERAAGVRATWFVLAGDPTLTGWRRGDLTYSLDGRAARELVDLVLADGHEIGLHGSFETRDDGALMARERERVARVTGRVPAGIRQHFLRLDPARTPALAESAGFAYDASYGFADRNAFRLGAAEILPLWQDREQRPLGIVEAPLAWMDRTHSKYLGQEDPAAWIADALDLARQAREAGGLWVGLWHPNVSAPLGFPGALEAFESLIGALASERPWLAPLEEIVAWRRVRRGLRVRLAEGGRTELVGEGRSAWAAEIEEISHG
ncbi:MAG TPA: hypothetical protein VG692_20435, partial [Gemmatimonadales bacterium]|nr:hypothetical protein [Gemmatimonadales bacterium]